MSSLGIHGAGHIAKFGARELHFSPWTQGMMDEFEEWLVARLRADRDVQAAINRKKARSLYREANRIREYGMEHTGEMSDEEKAKIQIEYEDVAGEAQALEFEAREMVNQIGDRKAAGFYHFYGALARESRGQFNGRVKIAHLSLLPHHPDITVIVAAMWH